MIAVLLYVLMSTSEMYLESMEVKGSPDFSHFIFESNVGKDQIRHRTTLNLNDIIFNPFGVALEIHYSISEALYVGSDFFR